MISGSRSPVAVTLTIDFAMISVSGSFRPIIQRPIVPRNARKFLRINLPTAEEAHKPMLVSVLWVGGALIVLSGCCFIIGYVLH
jgi:CHASE1-domain containing sensor protein